MLVMDKFILWINKDGWKIIWKENNYIFTCLIYRAYARAGDQWSLQCESHPCWILSTLGSYFVRTLSHSPTPSCSFFWSISHSSFTLSPSEIYRTKSTNPSPCTSTASNLSSTHYCIMFLRCSCSDSKMTIPSLDLCKDCWTAFSLGNLCYFPAPNWLMFCWCWLWWEIIFG